jgi:hypothetical protein
MSGVAAIRAAVDVLLLPSRVRLLKKEPLPEGVALVLRIAAGDGEAVREATAATDKPAETARAAAAFFIEQILLDPEGDSYRILGARSDATTAELRRNVALLLKWLHPDLDQNAERSIFAGRVTGAWNNLKTRERRAAYDLARSAQEAVLSRGKHRTAYTDPPNGPRDRGETPTRYPKAANDGTMHMQSQITGFRARGRRGIQLLNGGDRNRALNMHSFEFPRADRSTIAAGLKWLRMTLFVVLAVVLLWLILTRSFVAYLATTEPEAALLLRAGDSTALVVLADQEFNASDKDKVEKGGQSGAASKPLAKLRERVETALEADPLNARAYRLLGQLAEAEGDAAKTAKLMQTAARLSLNETIAVDWMMRKRFDNKDYPAAAFYADALLRTRPQFMDYALPILGRIAENKDAKGEIERLLAAYPPWRPQFFSMLGKAITDARTPLELLLALKDTSAPPAPPELHAYLAFLFQHKLYDLAYYVWLQFLAPEQLASAGFLFNGSFESKPSGSPFDWAMPQGKGVTADIAPRPEAGGKRALFIEFGQGRVAFPGVSQTTVLPPGAYRLKGSFKGEVTGPRGMQWSISCVGGAAIGASHMFLGSYPVWRDFEFDFVVPGTGCRAQSALLVLAARSASEQLVSGSIWFDELSISAQPAEPAK